DSRLAARPPGQRPRTDNLSALCSTPFPKDRFIEPFISENERVVVILGFDHGQTISPKPFTSILVLDTQFNCLSESVTIFRRNQQPIEPVDHEFWNSSHVRRDDGLSERHGFQKNDPKRFGARG